MRISQLFIPTLFEEPQEAEAISHKLMLRAAMIRRLSSGIYSYLPLGLKVLRTMERIIREEMDAIGCQEVLLPALTPAHLWQETGRWDAYGDDMFRLNDRKGSKFALGPTHEEIITDLVRQEVKSYRQLPVSLYQIQTKFRDELRPRFGTMRAREFLMKDAYSFHRSDEESIETYMKFYQAYEKIFTRCGFNFKAVEADSGLIGGNLSHEFIAPADIGEDTIVECSACNYAANQERAEGDKCPMCGKELKTSKGIELGHTFNLGIKYSKAMNANFTDETGKEKTIIMGCYGIGVSRLIPAYIEQHHDASGIIWDPDIAPYQVIVLPLNVKDSCQFGTAEGVYYKLQNAGISVLLDDRDERPGRKFTDAELLGIPMMIVVGAKTKATGNIEITCRRQREKYFEPIETFMERVGEILGRNN
ncbi:MAG: proline--tRNA ligase [Candidatus Desantisbacteria bacterium]